jgi:hypothetical protein
LAGGWPFSFSFFCSSVCWACARSIRPARSAIKVPAVAETEAVTIKEVPKRTRWRMVILAPTGSSAQAAEYLAPNGQWAARAMLLENAIGAL